MSKIEVDKIDPQSGTALEIGTSGDTVTVPSGVTLTTTNATVNLPASVGGLGTGITNAQLAGSIDVTTKITGVVPTANLGSGSASSSVFLAGDSTWIEAGGGAMVKVATADYSSGVADFTITDCFSTTYPIYKVYVYNILAVADDNQFQVYFLEDDDSTVGNFQTTSAGAYIQYASTAASTTGQNAPDLDYIKFTSEDLQSEANKITTLEMTIFQPFESAHTVVHYNYILNADNDYIYTLNGVAYLKSTTSVRSIKFQTSNSNNFSSYKTVIYGLDRS